MGDHSLRKELDQNQNRLSKLVEMHLDGTIEAETYHSKTTECKKRQREIITKIFFEQIHDQIQLLDTSQIFELCFHHQNKYK